MSKEKGESTRLTIREWWNQNCCKYNSYKEAASACVKELGVNRKSISNLNIKLTSRGSPLSDSSFVKPEVNKLGISEEQLRLKYDTLYKLDQALKKIPPGKFIPEREFRTLVSVDSMRFKSKSTLPKYDIYKGKAQGVTYWGNPRDIEKLKKEGVLQS